jgi:putative sigma-54 modulation protein
MNVDITGRQVEVTPALRKHAEGKLKKLERLLGGPLEAHIVLAVEKHRHLAEIQVKSRTALFTGMRETGDLYASINEVIEKLERQAQKHKDKLTSLKKRDGKKAAAVVAEPAPAVAPAPRIRVRPAVAAKSRTLRSERYRLKPLSAEDAALELEGTGDEVLVYRDSRTYRVNVVYRRKDGQVGLVDPEF